MGWWKFGNFFQGKNDSCLLQLNCHTIFLPHSFPEFLVNYILLLIHFSTGFPVIIRQMTWHSPLIQAPSPAPNSGQSTSDKQTAKHIQQSLIDSLDQSILF